MRKLVFLLLILVAANSHAQNKYVEGTYRTFDEVFQKTPVRIIQ
jgi:hypothetical protein